ncbi:Uncharacterised protein [Vibrio cholerae]|nr:Uncharacterised protein [Vibrio cholerae]CSB33585.1 Uncharacterised protein [Vibrio cholerae]CSC34187.1 Uncharacterised protein [Vibrio cholerae]
MSPAQQYHEQTATSADLASLYHSQNPKYAFPAKRGFLSDVQIRFAQKHGSLGLFPNLLRTHPSRVPSWPPYYFLYSGNAAKSKPK